MSKFFVNLSNHSTEKWSDAQRAAAKELGKTLCNYTFPNIPPSATFQEVRAMAKASFEVIYNDMYDAQSVVVHIAGESTFVACFLRLAQDHGLPCVTATSERNTVENADGTKTVRFDFCQFRPLF